MKRKILALVFILLLVSSLVACKKEDARQSDKPLVYASFYPIYNLTKSVSGEEIDVKSFMPLDKDPHLWEPSPRDIKRLSEADLLIVNGANMESWLDDIKETLPDLNILALSDYVELITYKGAAAIGDFQYMTKLNLKNKRNTISFGHTHEDLMRVAFYNNSDNLPLEDLIKKGKEIMAESGKVIKQNETIPVESGQVYGIEMGHESGRCYYELPEEGNWVFISDRISEDLLSYSLVDLDGSLTDIEVLVDYSTSQLDKIAYDPHSWMSIVNTKKYLNAIQETFSQMYPDNSDNFRRSKVDMVESLTKMEFEYKDKFDSVEIKEFVVTHNAYSYLARDFGLTQFPLQNLISMEDPSLKTIKTAINFCHAYDIDTLFYEYGRPKEGAKTIAEEIGGRTLDLASMEYLVGEQAENEEDYIDLMEKNLDNLYESMR